MIPNEEREKLWHCLAVKNYLYYYYLHFYCLNCLHSFRTENKLRSHEKLCKIEDFSGTVMPSEKNNY